MRNCMTCMLPTRNNDNTSAQYLTSACLTSIWVGQAERHQVSTQLPPLNQAIVAESVLLRLCRTTSAWATAVSARRTVTEALSPRPQRNNGRKWCGDWCALPCVPRTDGAGYRPVHCPTNAALPACEVQSATAMCSAANHKAAAVS